MRQALSYIENARWRLGAWFGEKLFGPVDNSRRRTHGIEPDEPWPRPPAKPHLSRDVDGNWRVWCWRCTDGSLTRWGLTPAEAYGNYCLGHAEAWERRTNPSLLAHREPAAARF